MRMRFKKQANTRLKAVDVECAASSPYSHLSPSEFMQVKAETVPHLLSELEKTDFSAVDCE